MYIIPTGSQLIHLKNKNSQYTTNEFCLSVKSVAYKSIICLDKQLVISLAELGFPSLLCLPTRPITERSYPSQIWALFLFEC